MFNRTHKHRLHVYYVEPFYLTTSHNWMEASPMVKILQFQKRLFSSVITGNENPYNSLEDNLKTKRKKRAKVRGKQS